MPTSEEIRKRALLEDQIPLEQMTPDQIRRKDARDRKRAQRELEKQAKAKNEADQKEEAVAKTIQEWWDINRSKLTTEERQKLEVVHQEMAEWCAVMDDYVSGTDGTTEQDLQDTIVDIRALVEERGLCETAILVVPKFWSDKPLFEAAINRARTVPKFRADEVFVRYGYYTALPTHTFEPFYQRFLRPKAAIFQPKYVANVCPDCNEIIKYTVGSGECNPLPSGKTITDGIKVLKDRCQRCDPTGQDLRTREWKEQEKKKIAARDILRSTVDENIYDQHGRVDWWRK